MDPHLNVAFFSIRKILQVFKLSTANWFIYHLENAPVTSYTVGNSLDIAIAIAIISMDLCLQVAQKY